MLKRANAKKASAVCVLTVTATINAQQYESRREGERVRES